MMKAFRQFMCVFVIVCVLLLGLRESDVADCVAWMRPFAHVLERQTPVELKKFLLVSADNAHNIQTHTVNLDLLVCVLIFFGLVLLTLHKILTSLRNYSRNRASRDPGEVREILVD